MERYKSKGYIVVMECASNSVLLIDDIINAGYEPVAVFIETTGEQDSVHCRFQRKYVRLFETEFAGKAELIFVRNDIDDCMKKLEPLGLCNIKAVITGMDIGVELTELLCLRLNLKGNPYDERLIRRNKFEMHEALKRAGLKFIKSKRIQSVSQAEQAWLEFGLEKVVLKPVLSAGTYGLHFCESSEEIAFYAEKIFGEPDRFGETNNEIVMEEYICGTEYIVNSYSCDGVHRISDIWVYNKCSVGSLGYAYDSMSVVNRLEPHHVEMIMYAYKVLDALDFKYGPCHGEYFITQSGPVLVEVNPRMMGMSLSAPLLDKVLGHHMSTETLDCYINPLAFEQKLRLPYKPNGYLLYKFIISPYDATFSDAPIMTILNSLPSFCGAVIEETLKSGKVTKTVDNLTSPAFVWLFNYDEHQLKKDYEMLAWLEKYWFDLLFTTVTQP